MSLPGPPGQPPGPPSKMPGPPGQPPGPPGRSTAENGAAPSPGAATGAGGTRGSAAASTHAGNASNKSDREGSSVAATVDDSPQPGGGRGTGSRGTVKSPTGGGHTAAPVTTGEQRRGASMDAKQGTRGGSGDASAAGKAGGHVGQTGRRYTHAKWQNCLIYLLFTACMVPAGVVKGSVCYCRMNVLPCSAVAVEV